MLRLGAVLSPDFSALPLRADGIFIESALPTDGRIHTVDVRDVARAFAAATTADVAGEICRKAGPVIRKATMAGSSPTGLTPPGRSRRCPSSIIRGRTCSPRCAHGWGGSAMRCDSSLHWRGFFSHTDPPTAMRRAATPICGESSAQGWASPAWTRSDGTPSRGPTGTCRSPGGDTSRPRLAFRRRRGWSGR